MTLEEAVRSAAESLRVPGQPDWRVIGPAQVEAIAREQELPRWQVEVAALEAEVVPLHYMRNIARFAMRGQLELLRTAVTVVSAGAPAEKCLRLLAAHGVGRLRVLVPASLGGRPATQGTESPRRHGGAEGRGGDGIVNASSPVPQYSAQALAAVAANQNASLEISSDRIDLRQGDPVALLGEPDVVVACVEDAAEEMLLQAACKRRRIPLVLGGLQEQRGQATTILPGDAGMALIYQSDYPHLDRSRPGSLRSNRLNGMAVGSWLAEQVIALRLGLGEVLQNRLLYADMSSGEFNTFPLG